MVNDKVSIIIPTYKRSDRIERAVESALKQNYSMFEVIVVDDNNPTSQERKKTEKVMSNFKKNPKVNYIKHHKNLNGSAARNTGIKYSTGQFITFLDDDDEYFPNKIKVQVNCLKKIDTSWGLCYTNFKKIDRKNRLQTSNEKVEGDVLIQALTKNLFIGSGSNFMVRREVIDELNGFDESFLRNQDLEFLVRALTKYKIKYCDEVTFLIHNEIREINYNYNQLELINKKYIEKFKPLISNLDQDSQIEVYKVLDLWSMRYAFSDKKLIKTLSIFNKSDLTYKDIYKYIKYLINRYKNNSSYGFKL